MPLFETDIDVIVVLIQGMQRAYTVCFVLCFFFVFFSFISSVVAPRTFWLSVSNMPQAIYKDIIWPGFLAFDRGFCDWVSLLKQIPLFDGIPINWNKRVIDHLKIRLEGCWSIISRSWEAGLWRSFILYPVICVPWSCMW